MKIKLTLLAIASLLSMGSSAMAGPQFTFVISSGGGNCNPRPVVCQPRPICPPQVYRRPVVYYNQPVYYGGGRNRDCGNDRYYNQRPVYYRQSSCGWRR